MRGKLRTRATVTASVAAATTTAMTLCAPLASADDSGQKDGRFTAGAPGVGDRYYPLAGNGGYDVGHYDITGTYDPATNVWSATTVITATATADLYRFDLDFDGMTISSLVVDGKPAGWSRDGAELVVVPQHKIKSGDAITIQAIVLRRAEGVPAAVGRLHPAHRLHGDRRRRDRGRAARRGGWLVPGQRPPEGQGGIRLPRDGAGRVWAWWPTGSSRARQPRAARPGSTGTHRNPWPATWPRSTSGNGTCGSGRRQSGLPVYDAVDPDLLSDPVLGPSINASLARQGEIVDVLSAAFGAYPFTHGRGDRRRPA